MSSTLTDKAVVGRRVTFTYYRDLDQADGPSYPGIITGTEPGLSGSLLARIRLDGARSTLSIPVAYEGLTYLDEVVPVPELPMGLFVPVADDRHGFYEKAGVLLAAIGEDGEDLILIAEPGRQEKAIEAAAQCLDSFGVDIHYVNFDAIRPHWAVFSWEPEDAECPWTVRWDAAEGDDKAVHIYYLPA